MSLRSAVPFLLALLLPGSAGAKELLTPAVIESYLNEKNPYIYTAVGQQYVSEARAEAAEGAFDTRLGVKYDNKRYPASEGELADVYVEKATESGVELLAGYRRAEGVQEYNNIKTGDDGEVRLGVKVPVFAVAKGMNPRRYALESAAIDAARSTYAAKENLRHLRFDVYAAYYTLLYRRSVASLESALLAKAREREGFVRSKVGVGELPEIALLEVQRQILNRVQRRLEALNGYKVALGSFTRFLGLSPEALEARYALPSLPEASAEELRFEEALQTAWEQRPDLRSLQYDKRRFGLQEEYNALSKYPSLNVALYGVHDFVYDNGVKVSLEMSFPVERRTYAGRKKAIEKGERAVDEALQRKRIEIETALSNRFETRRMLRENLKNAGDEVSLAERLEAAEVRKYRLGAGDLVMVNQRELTTLEVRQKALSYRLRLLLQALEIARELGSASAPAVPGENMTVKTEGAGQ
ncbi:TolC family protein [Thiomicrolovo sp. ZZH C-3]